MRWFLLFLAAAFFGTLAAVAGVRAVVEVESFVVGVICGVAASVPASVLAYYLSRPATPAAPPEPHDERNYPPLVIVNGPAPARAQRQPDFPMPAASEASPLSPRYRVVGDE